MINYRKGKERFKPNDLGSLYLKEGYDKENHNIYIGGQLEQTGFTCDAGHNMFNGSWFYDYPYNEKLKIKDAYNELKNSGFIKNFTELLSDLNS